MNTEFKDKAMLVTGAASGIGRAVAEKFAECGAITILADINLEAAVSTAREIAEKFPGVQVVSMKVDVTDPKSCKALMDEITSEFGSLYGMAHCAGVLANAPFVDIPKKDVDFVIDVNLKGTLYILQAAGSVMLKQGYGKICVVASKAGKIGTPTLAHYAASKFGVIGLVQTAAMEWGEAGVYVNCVCPGEVDTPMLRKSYEKICEIEGITMEEQVKIGSSMSLVKRLSPPENIANCMLFLLGKQSDEIIGQAINVDGGIIFH
ncbi:MAG: SDR family NAD(P)-dependent oxidoreductase [Christensenellaceae bacterium]